MSTKRLWAVAIALAVIGTAAQAGPVTGTTIEPMPPQLETRFALSALPPALRDRASVYLLDPGKGYHLTRQGTSGVTCLVERTVWEWVDYRNDIYAVVTLALAIGLARFVDSYLVNRAARVTKVG